MATLGALIGADIQTGGPNDEMEEMTMETEEPTKEEEPKKEEPKKEEPKETPKNVLDALAEKEKGNAFYKKKDFETALKHYDNAVELDPTNCIYLLNKAAVYVEQKKYKESIEECEKAIDIGRKERIGYDTIAKCFTRIGNAYLKQENFDAAIKAYKEALTEHRSPETLQKLKDAEKLKKKKEDEEYFSEELSIEEKNKGNQLFKEGQAIKAIEHYKEALKRNPKDHTIYHNKAAAYMKLLSYPSAAIDLKKCLDMDPNYMKAYVKLGQCYFHMKDFNNAIKILNEGLAIEPENKTLRDTLKMVESEISNASYDKERIEQAKKDPEIQAILQDPIMQNVLRDLGQDPVASQKHLADPSIAKKIEKLVIAGIIQTGRK
jgi:stress-induced-phosphoprotein 1